MMVEKTVDVTSITIIVATLITEVHGIVTVIPITEGTSDHIMNGKDIIINIVTIIEMKDTIVAMTIS